MSIRLLCRIFAYLIFYLYTKYVGNNKDETASSLENNETQVGNTVIATLTEALHNIEPDTPEDELFRTLFNGINEGMESASKRHLNETPIGKDAKLLTRLSVFFDNLTGSGRVPLDNETHKNIGSINGAAERLTTQVQAEANAISIREGYIESNKRITEAIPQLIEAQPETESGIQIRELLRQIDEQLQQDNRFLKLRIFQEYIRYQSSNPEGYYTRDELQGAVIEMVPLWEMDKYKDSDEYRKQITEKLDSYGIVYDADKLITAIGQKRETFYGKS